MPARGDITAAEVYADREMLNRLGYGIFDVNFGSAGIGSENIKDFTYLVTHDDDPRLYRRKVYEVTGRYYANRLAKAIWDRLIDKKLRAEEEGREADLSVIAQEWLEKESHQFLKDWTFRQPVVPERIRNRAEPSKGLLETAVSQVSPRFRELLDAGFSITDITRAAIQEAANPGPWKELLRPTQPKEHRHSFLNSVFQSRKRREEKERSHDEDYTDDNPYFLVKKLSPEEITEGRYYVRMVANLTGHEPQSKEEAERRWREILEHKWYMSERAGHDVGLRASAIDYFRRLSLIQEVETGQES